uniref:Pyruvate dehydrogenase complex beta-subunit n=1 Tax=Limosilactobacillus reuteri TaxID=1598 RepID=Q7X2B3_LIMRT|nr:pyruvate dehydrogenase complex beta-subunit [Limosilactobacillus reuteri]
MAKKTYIKAITEGIDIALAEDPKTLVFGEDVGKNGGVFRATNGLQEKYGKDRVFSTPLAESGILGLSIGLAATGWRPVSEIQFMGFTFEAMDSIAGQMSRVRFPIGWSKNMPITIRLHTVVVSTAELHGDDLENFFVGIPGLRVVTPSSAYDAKGLVISAIENNDPVLFLENLRLYRSVKGEVPDDKYTVPLDKANVVEEGNDVTIIAYGGEVSEAQKAAKKLAKKNISAEIIDLRSLYPLDTDTIFESIKKTHRVVIVQEAQKMAGVGAQVASAISEGAIMYLDAPVIRVAAPNSVYPFPQAENVWLPGADDIEDAATQAVNY